MMTDTLRDFLNTHKPKSTHGVFNLVLAEIPTTPRIAVDLCCGDGGLTQQLRERGWQAYGLDLSDHFIGTRAADRNGFIVSDASQTPLRAGCADLVLCVDSLQYFADPQSALQEMHRLLRPGGTLIFSTQNNSSPSGWKRWLMERLTGHTWSPWLAHPVENHLTYGQLMRLLNETDFQIEQVRGMQFLTAWVALLPSFVRHWQPFPNKPWRTLAGVAQRVSLPTFIEKSPLKRLAMMTFVKVKKPL